jgi:8-oxo-dGTP diphosphatase
MEPKIGVGVMILRNGKVLLGRRNSSHGAGEWCFPGGHLEFNESLFDCARREVDEETGIKISNLKKGSYTEDIFEKEGKHYITIFIIADYESGDVVLKEPEKSDGWCWFSIDDLPRPLFRPIESLIKDIGGLNGNTS